MRKTSVVGMCVEKSLGNGLKGLSCCLFVVACGGSAEVISAIDGGADSEASAMDSGMLMDAPSESDTGSEADAMADQGVEDQDATVSDAAADAGVDAPTDGGLDTGCSPGAPTGQLLWTTLDDASSIASPVLGNGSGAAFVSTPVDDFEVGLRCRGLRIDQDGEYLELPQSGNIDFQRGTMQIAYRPDAAHTDGLDHMFFAASNAPTRGGIYVRKAGAANANALQVIYFDSSGSLAGETEVPASAYGWSAGEWVELRVTWDFTVALAEQNIHVYINAIEPTYVGSTGPAPMPTAASGQSLRIGVRDGLDEWPAGGVLDELMIWDSPMAP